MRKLFVQKRAGIFLIISVALIVALAVSIRTDITHMDATEEIINVTVDGQPIYFDSQNPVFVDGRIFVPIHGVFEKLDFRIDWNNSRQTVTLTRNNQEIVIIIGNDFFYIGDEAHTLDAPAQIISGQVMLPIRAIVESLGYYIVWDAATRTALVGFSTFRGEFLENFRAFVTDVHLMEPYLYVLAYYDELLWATWSRGKYNDRGNLLKSGDRGNTWEQVYVFYNPIDVIHFDGFGNIFVTTSIDRWGDTGMAQLFRSADGGVSFALVLDIISGAPYHWNIASKDGIMFLSEYGYKGSSDNARRIYRSLDFGSTWHIVFEPPPTYNWHNHKIIITDAWAVYQSIGDMPHNHIIRSLDYGNTWELAIENLHPTAAVQIGNYILWGLDSGANPDVPNSGIARYCIAAGEIESFWIPPYPFSGSCYDIAVANGIIYALFLSYGGDVHPASIWYSKDEGRIWNLMGYIEKQPFTGIGLWALTVDDMYGYIIVQTPTDFTSGIEFLGTLRFRLLS